MHHEKTGNLGTLQAPYIFVEGGREGGTPELDMADRVDAVSHQGCHNLNCIGHSYKFIDSVSNFNELFLAVALLVLVVAHILNGWYPSGTQDYKPSSITYHA